MMMPGERATPDQIRVWAQAAGKGDKMIYFTGARLPQTSAARRAAHDLACDDLVITLQGPLRGGERDYLMQRTAKRWPTPPRATERASVVALLDEDEARLLGFVEQVIADGARFPETASIASALTIKQPHVFLLLNRLRERGLIGWEVFSNVRGQRWRVVWLDDRAQCSAQPAGPTWHLMRAGGW